MSNLQKKKFDRTQKEVGKVCLKFPSQYRQASYTHSTVWETSLPALAGIFQTHLSRVPQKKNNNLAFSPVAPQQRSATLSRTLFSGHISTLFFRKNFGPLYSKKSQTQCPTFTLPYLTISRQKKS